MKDIESFLCIPCALRISELLKVTPLYQTTVDAQECPWCEKKSAFMKFRVRCQHKN